MQRPQTQTAENPRNSSGCGRTWTLGAAFQTNNTKLVTSTFQLSAVHLTCKPDESTLSASTRLINSIRQYQTVEATKILVCAFVLSNSECCKSLLSGCPFYLLSRLQKQNWFSKHTNVIMCSLFCKLFISYQSKPEYIANRQLSQLLFISCLCEINDKRK